MMSMANLPGRARLHSSRRDDMVIHIYPPIHMEEGVGVEQDEEEDV